jgi:peroxiredoxin Q/BCP
MIGSVAPPFVLEGTRGRFRLSDELGRRVVLLFYPGDNARVCTRQFCSYRDRVDEMEQLEAVVVGISSQPVASHRAFAEAHGLTVELLSDPRGRVARAYGVGAGAARTRRAVVVIDEAGRVRYRRAHPFGLTFVGVAGLRAVLDGLDVAAGRGRSAEEA